MKQFFENKEFNEKVFKEIVVKTEKDFPNYQKYNNPSLPWWYGIPGLEKNIETNV
jgi:hypothetical protein